MLKKDDTDNRANQLNPNNSAYWSSRRCDFNDDDYEASGPVDGYTFMRCRAYSYGEQFSPTAQQETRVDCTIPFSTKMLLLYVNDRGRADAVSVEGNSEEAILAAINELWGSNRFFYLELSLHSDIVFIEERLPEGDNPKIKALIEKNIMMAKEYLNVSDFGITPLLLSNSSCHVDGLVKYIFF